jgi:anionic cell wall polymer biosynthesis LytR-Cps2A-Psr (LCP) family protein
MLFASLTSRQKVAGCLGLVFGLSALLSFGWFWWRSHAVAQPPTQADGTPAPIPTPTPDPLAPITIALLGYGGGGHAGGALTDSIIVAKIKPHLKQVLLISIPRDLWITIPHLDQTSKINLAYAAGLDTRRWPESQRPPELIGPHAGGNLAKETLSQVVGFPVQHYLAVSFSGFLQAIDELGGVEVKVPVSFVDEFYPIEGKENETCDRSPEDIAALTATMSGFKLEQQFPCRYERLEFTAGPTTLDAATALKFARSRHSDVNGNDFGRSLRQQAVIQGVKQKLLSPSVWPKLPIMASHLVKFTDTDLGLPEITQALTTLPDLGSYQLYSYSLTPTTGLVASHSADRQYTLVPAANLGWTGLQQNLADWEAQVATGSADTTPTTTKNRAGASSSAVTSQKSDF